MKFSGICFLLLITVSGLYAQCNGSESFDRVPYRKGNQWGLMHKCSKIISFLPIYDSVYISNPTTFYTKKGDWYGLVACKTNLCKALLDPIYEKIVKQSYTDFYAIKRKGKYGMIKVAANTNDYYLILKTDYDRITSTLFSDHYKVMKDGLWGLIKVDSKTNNYELVAPFEYTKIELLAEGILFEKDGKQGWMNKAGKVLFDNKHSIEAIGGYKNWYVVRNGVDYATALYDANTQTFLSEAIYELVYVDYRTLSLTQLKTIAPFNRYNLFFLKDRSGQYYYINRAKELERYNGALKEIDPPEERNPTVFSINRHFQSTVAKWEEVGETKYYEKKIIKRGKKGYPCYRLFDFDSKLPKLRGKMSADYEVVAHAKTKKLGVYHSNRMKGEQLLIPPIYDALIAVGTTFRGAKLYFMMGVKADSTLDFYSNAGIRQLESNSKTIEFSDIEGVVFLLNGNLKGIVELERLSNSSTDHSIGYHPPKFKFLKYISYSLNETIPIFYVEDVKGVSYYVGSNGLTYYEE